MLSVMPGRAAILSHTSTGKFLLRGMLAISIVSGPLAVRLIAADGAPAKPETKVAKKMDDGTRLGSEKGGNQHPLLPALQLAKSSQESLKKVHDYTASFIKRERIKDQLVRQNMELKFRQQPLSVYLRYYEPHAGREVIFVEGKNKGKLLVHEDGLKALAGTLSFLPTSADAMEENRYPITKAGMRTMLELLITQWEQELKFGEVEVKHYPNAKVGTVECKMVETTHQQPRPHFNFHKSCLYIDKQTNLPVRLEQFGFPSGAGEAAPLHEEYTFTNIHINVGLTDHDFDTKNKDYKF